MSAWTKRPRPGGRGAHSPPPARRDRPRSAHAGHGRHRALQAAAGRPEDEVDPDRAADRRRRPKRRGVRSGPARRRSCASRSARSTCLRSSSAWRAGAGAAAAAPCEGGGRGAAALRARSSASARGGARAAHVAAGVVPRDRHVARGCARVARHAHRRAFAARAAVCAWSCSRRCIPVCSSAIRACGTAFSCTTSARSRFRIRSSRSRAR